MEERVTVTPDARLDYGISNIMGDAADALVAEGRMLSYSATGTVSDVPKGLMKDQHGGFVESGVARTEVSVNGGQPVVRQVDPGAYKMYDLTSTGIKAVHGLEILDDDGNVIRSKSMQMKTKGRSFSYGSTNDTYGKDFNLLSRTESDCTIKQARSGDTQTCEGTTYDSKGEKAATYKSSRWMSKDGNSMTTEEDYFDNAGNYMGTIRGESKKDAAKRQATVSVNITDTRRGN